MAMPYVPSQEEPRPLESSQDTPALSETSISKEQPSEMVMPYVPSQEELKGVESSQDTPALSEASISKEQPSEMAMPYVPSQEDRRRLESAQDTPALSEISFSKEHHSEGPSYVVEKFEKKDNAGYVATWKHRVNKLLPFSSIIAIGSYWLYLAFRVRYTVAAQRINHKVYPMAWIFLSIEVGVARESSYIPRIHVYGCLLMQISHSASTAHSTVAMFLDQASPPS